MQIEKLDIADLQYQAGLGGDFGAAVGDHGDHGIKADLFSGTKVTGQDIVLFAVFVKGNIAFEYNAEAFYRGVEGFQYFASGQFDHGAPANQVTDHVVRKGAETCQFPEIIQARTDQQWF